MTLQKSVNQGKSSNHLMAKVVASFFKLVCNHKTKISYMPSEKYSKIADAVNYLHANYLDNDFKVDLLEK